MNIMDSIARLAAPSKMTGMQENSDLEAEPLSSSAKFVILARFRHSRSLLRHSRECGNLCLIFLNDHDAVVAAEAE